ncbi:MAG TPA: DUF2064 domain-containing protein [Burkholderiales bacterium]|jgi:hypothetical protein
MAVKLLLLAQDDASNLEVGLALAEAWQRGGGAAAAWCWPSARALPGALHASEVLQMPPAPNLGAAIWSVACRSLARGATPLLACPGAPGLAPAHLRRGEELLAHRDAVFGTTATGYAMVGLKRAVPELFAGVPWDTAEVMAATRARARRYGCRIAELALVPD